MEPERWKHIKDAFSAALELPPEQRAEWLSVTVPDDPSLAREVKELLAAYEGATDFYEQGALAAVPEVKRQLEGDVEGMRVGPYRVLSELGHGGMGAVYLAVRDPASFTHKVALKVIKRGMDTDEIVRRFVAERQILASLAHPNIARLFDGGSTPDGRPYFVMEYVEGRPITVYAGEHELDVEARLRLFLRVCRAVQHAHQSLVVHRDLKPANILVDAEGEPKLLDFGIAKLLDPSSFDGTTVLTGLAPGPMTPDYAAPEQLAGGAVTTATDVHGLGILLYELLVGQNPRSAERKLGAGWSARPPSQALAALNPARDAESRRRARRVAGDLDTIVGKALEREPERRYGTAAALAEDVERHLTQRPVAARRPTLAYRLSRGVLRHKLAAALALALCLFAGFSFREYLVASRERDRAQAQRRQTEELNLLMQRTIRQSGEKGFNLQQAFDDNAQKILAQDTRHDLRTTAGLLETIGTLYKELGFYEGAPKYLERALRLRERRRHPDRDDEMDIARCLTLLGQVAVEREDFEASRRDFERALAIKERLLDAGALDLVGDLNGLAAVAREEKRLDDATRYLNRSFAIARAAENGRRELAETRNALGELARAKRDPASAQSLFSAALGYLESTLGADHPLTLEVEGNLAVVLFERSEHAAARTLFQKIVDMRRRLVVQDQPGMASDLLHLAIAQRQLGDTVKARANLDESMQIRRAYRLSPDWVEGESWNLLGHFELDQNRLGAASEAFKKSLATFRAVSGERSEDVARVRNSQAELRRRALELLLRRPGSPSG
jgi:serine/threonine-protein kinase